MNMTTAEYNEIFWNAKQYTVYTHSMIWFNEVMKNNAMTDKEKYLEIRKIILASIDHLEDEK